MRGFLPVGWRIGDELVLSGSELEVEYIAYRWQKYTEKKWPWSKPVVRIGWRQAGYASWRREDVARWIIDTAAAEAANEHTV